MRKGKSRIFNFPAKKRLSLLVASEEEWWQKAQAMFPYSSSLLHLLAETDANIYRFLDALLPLCQQAYRSECDWELQRIFDYVDWCWQQDCDKPDGDLSNAAGVAFYEHILDYVPSEVIRRWVKPGLYEMLPIEPSLRDRLHNN